MFCCIQQQYHQSHDLTNASTEVMPEQVHPLLLIEVHMLAFPVNSNQLQ
jgi:hypothetical protein